MHRAVLLTLLSIPVLVIMHIALFWQPIPGSSEMFWSATQGGALSRDYWPAPDRAMRSQFVVEHKSEQGS